MRNTATFLHLIQIFTNHWSNDEQQNYTASLNNKSTFLMKFHLQKDCLISPSLKSTFHVDSLDTQKFPAPMKPDPNHRQIGQSRRTLGTWSRDCPLVRGVV